LLHRHVGKRDCDHSGIVCGRDEVIISTVKNCFICNWIIQNSWLTSRLTRVKLTLEQAMKAQMGSRGVALLQCHALAALPHRKIPSSHCIGGWVCPRGKLAPTPSESLYQLPSSKYYIPYTTYGPRSHTKYEVLSAKFPSQACES
jgi:hypothetical protein